MEASEVYREQKVRNSSTMMAVKRAYEIIGDHTCTSCPRQGEVTEKQFYYMV
jgi:hypothetical protein